MIMMIDQPTLPISYYSIPGQYMKRKFVSHPENISFLV